MRVDLCIVLSCVHLGVAVKIRRYLHVVGIASPRSTLNLLIGFIGHYIATSWYLCRPFNHFSALLIACKRDFVDTRCEATCDLCRTRVCACTHLLTHHCSMVGVRTYRQATSSSPHVGKRCCCCDSKHGCGRKRTAFEPCHRHPASYCTHHHHHHGYYIGSPTET